MFHAFIRVDCRTISLGSNGLVGILPDLGLLTALSSLLLPNNSITFAPASLLWLPPGAVDLSSNQLTGPMPTLPAGTTVPVSVLNVSNNNYDGPLPVGAIESSTSAGATFDLSWNLMSTTGATGLDAYCLSHGLTCMTSQVSAPSAPSMPVVVGGDRNATIAWVASR
jgi:hypothetical protein